MDEAGTESPAESQRPRIWLREHTAVGVSSAYVGLGHFMCSKGSAFPVRVCCPLHQEMKSSRGLVAHAFNSGTQEAEANESV